MRLLKSQWKMGTVPNFSAGQKEGSQLSPAPPETRAQRTRAYLLKPVYQIFRFCQELSAPAGARTRVSYLAGRRSIHLSYGSITYLTAKASKRFLGKWGLSLSPRMEGKHD